MHLPGMAVSAESRVRINQRFIHPMISVSCSASQYRHGKRVGGMLAEHEHAQEDDHAIARQKEREIQGVSYES